MPAFQRLVPSGQKLTLEEFTLTDRIVSEIAKTGVLNIYIRRVVGLGDVLMVALIAHALKQKLFSHTYKVHLVTSPHFQDLIKKLKLVNSVLTDDDVSGSFIVNLQDKVDFLPVCTTGHRLDLMADSVGLHIKDVQTDFKIKMNPQWHAWGRRHLKRFSSKKKIAFSPWATAKIRSWPEWSEFMSLLLQSGNYVVVLLHDKPMRVLGHPNLINLTGETNTVQLCSVLSECDAAVAVDSGVLHTCGFLDIPFVGLFGPINPEFRVKYYEKKEIIFLPDSCPKCPCWDWQTGACSETDYFMNCMWSITPAMVFKSLEKLLETYTGVHEVKPESRLPWGGRNKKPHQILEVGA